MTPVYRFVNFNLKNQSIFYKKFKKI